MFFIGTFILSYPFDHKPPQISDIPNHMRIQPNQIKYTDCNTYGQSYIQIIIPYGSNKLPIKELSLSDPLFFSKLDNKVNIFTTLLVDKATPTISNKNPFLYFSQFSPPFSALTCSQNRPYNPHSHVLPLYLSNF